MTTRQRGGVLANAGGPRQWCRATVRRTTSVDHVDTCLRAVCEVRPSLPRLVEGPLLGRSLDECTRPRDQRPAPDPEEEQAPRARTSQPAPPPRQAPLPPEPPRRTERPVLMALPPRRPAPTVQAADCVSPQRLAELAGLAGATGAGRRAGPTAPAVPPARPGRAGAAAGPAGAPPPTRLAAPGGGRAVRTLPVPPGVPAAVVHRLVERAGLSPQTVAATGGAPVAAATRAERGAVRVALDHAADGRGPDRADSPAGRPAPDGPAPADGSERQQSGTRPARPAAPLAAPPPSSPGIAPSRQHADGVDRVPVALPSVPPRVSDDDGLPFAVPSPVDRPRHAPAAGLPHVGRADDLPTRHGTGAGLTAVPALPTPELERLLDQVLTDAARRHGIEV